MSRYIFIRGLLAWCACAGALAQASAEEAALTHAAGLRRVDSRTLSGAKHFVRDYPPRNTAGDLMVVVEIPTGSIAKWEVDAQSGDLVWELRNGKPREVRYLGYPGNYGMIPRTLLPIDAGGDGDPLDVLVLGAAVPRGSVIAARPIGMLRMLDNGEQDDKIIAVAAGTEFEAVASLAELRQEFPGAAEIVELWFTNYKGPGEMVSRGLVGLEEANAIIQTAIDAYRKQSKPQAAPLSGAR